MQNETILINGIEYPATYNFTEAEKLQNSPEIEGLERVVVKDKKWKSTIEKIYYTKNGKKHGSCKGYFAGGLISYEIDYKNGRMHGLTRTFSYVHDDDGTGWGLVEEETYVNGKKHGSQKKYNGKKWLYSECIYKNGVKLKNSGWYKNGCLKIEIIFMDGEFYRGGSEIAKFYDENGKFEKYCILKKNEITYINDIDEYLEILIKAA